MEVMGRCRELWRVKEGGEVEGEESGEVEVGGEVEGGGG